MPVVQDQLSATNTNITFEDINSAASGSSVQTGISRLIHDGTDIIRLNNSGVIRYYQTDGTAKVNYVVGGVPTSGIVEDIAYDYNSAKLYALYSVPSVTTTTVISGTSFYYDAFTYTGVGFDPAIWSDYSGFSIVNSGLHFAGTGNANLKLNGALSNTLVFKTVKLNINSLTMSGAVASGVVNYADRLSFNISGFFGNHKEVGIVKVGNAFNLYEYTTNTGTLSSPIINVPYGVSGASVNTYLEINSTTFDANTNFQNGNINLSYTTLVSGNSGADTVSFVTLRNNILVDTQTYPWFNVSSGIYCPPDSIVSGNYVVYTYTGIEGTVLNERLYNPFIDGYSTVWLKIPTLTGTKTPVVSISNSGIIHTDENINPSGIFSISLSGNNVIFNNSNYYRQAEITFDAGSSPRLSINASTASGMVLEGDGFLANLVDTVTTSSVVTTVPSRLEIRKLNLDGTVNSVVTSGFIPHFGGNNLVDSSTVREIAVNEQNPYIYVRLGTSLIRMDNTAYTGNIDETTSGILVGYNTLESFANPVNTLFYNKTLDNLTYLQYDGITQEVRLLTADPINLNQLTRKVFVNIPDFAEHYYPIFYQHPDYNSLFYLRMVGTNQLNSNKISSSTGVCNSTGILTDVNQNFTTSKVKKGDILFFTNGTQLGNSYSILNVNSTTSLTLANRNTGTQAAFTAGTFSYTLMSNAEQLHFNVDPAISAFSAINVGDYSLPAGNVPAVSTSVLVSVINSWGDPLGGKNVNFQIIAGDGAISPSAVTLSGTGVASGNYTAGTSVGAVQIQATVSD